MRWFLSPYLLKIKTILICDTSWNSRKSSIRGISAVAQSSNLLWVVPLPLFPLSDSRQMHANYWMAHRLTEKKNKEQPQKNDSSPNEAFFYSSERLSQLKMAFYCNSRHHQAKAGLPMINMQDKWSPCLSWKVNSESHLRAYSNWSAVAGHILIWRSWPTASVHTNTRDSCQYMTLCLVSKILLFMKVMQYTWASKPRLQ